MTAVPPTQLPAWQVSLSVHASPSLQDVPFTCAGFEQTPVDVSQVPAVWHWSTALQVVGVPAVQTPAWHESPVVHALASSHVEPFALAGFEQRPVEALHVPASWH